MPPKPFSIAVYRASSLISRGAEALCGSSANQYLSRISLLSAISERVYGRDNRTLVGDRDGWEPVDEETKNRCADIVSPGALRLDYRAELRNRGAEGATVRAWRWWVADAWDRSYHYLPLESRMELTRVGEERKWRPLEEGEEGEAYTVPAGGFATLSFEGLSSLRRASGGRARGVHTGVRGVLPRSARLHRDGEEPLVARETMVFDERDGVIRVALPL